MKKLMRSFTPKVISVLKISLSSRIYHIERFDVQQKFHCDCLKAVLPPIERTPYSTLLLERLTGFQVSHTVVFDYIQYSKFHNTAVFDYIQFCKFRNTAVFDCLQFSKFHNTAVFDYLQFSKFHNTAVFDYIQFSKFHNIAVFD